MSTAWLAAAMGAVTVLALGSRMPAGERARRPTDPGPTPPVGTAPGERADGRSRSLHRRAGPDHGAPGGAAIATVGKALVVLALLAGAWVLGPVPAAVMTLGALLLRARLYASAERRRVERVARAVPELIDLFHVAATAGHPAARCVELVTSRSPGVCRPALVRASRRSAAGASLAASLEPVGRDLGPSGRALVEVLLGAQRTGAPLATGLAQLAATSRDARRRQAETRARRLPVTMLFPLVCCVLPAFGLLAVVPLLAASLGSLRL